MKDRTKSIPGPLWSPGIRVEILFVLIALLLLGLPNLVYPFGSDQGEYAHIGAEMLAGKVIYRDVFNVKPPVTHLLHAAALELFGRSMLAIRLLDWIWQAGTGVALALVTAMLYRRRYAPLLAGIVYGVCFYSVDFWHSAQTESFLNLFTILGVLFFLLGLRSARSLWQLGAGAMVSLAVLTKYPIGLLLPFLLVVLFLVQGWNRPMLRHALGMCLGFAFPLALFAVITGLRGGLGPFLEIQFGYIPFYNAGFARDRSYLGYTWDRFLLFWDLKPAIRLFALVWLAEVLLTGLVTPWPRYQWLVPLWGVAGIVHPAVQNQYNDVHLHTLLPPLAIMIAHFFLNLDALAGRFTPRLRPLVFLSAAAVPLLLAFIPASPYRQRDLQTKVMDFWAVASRERSLEEQYVVGDYGVYGWGYSARALVEVGDYVQARTSPGESIFVWSFEPAVYFLSERESASRFIFNFPLYGDFAWPEYRDEFLSDLERERPAYVLIAHNDAIPWVSGSEDDSQAAFEKFTPFRTFVEREYELADRLAQFTVYERKSDS